MGRLFDYGLPEEPRVPSLLRRSNRAVQARLARGANRGEKLMAELASLRWLQNRTSHLRLTRFEDSRQYLYVVRTGSLGSRTTGMKECYWTPTRGPSRHVADPIPDTRQYSLQLARRATYDNRYIVDYLAYRIFVVVVGLVIVMLSVTGVYVWWKKRKARIHANSRAASATAPLTPQTRISASASTQ